MIPKNTPTINLLPPQKPARPYLCVATPVELARLAGASGIDVLSCVDPIGRKVYDIALAALAQLAAGHNVGLAAGVRWALEHVDADDVAAPEISQRAPQAKREVAHA